MQGFRVYFVAFSIRWFVWQVSNRKNVFKSVVFYIVLDFSNIIVGILFVEPDLQGVRVHFVAFSIRWFVL